MSIAKGYDGGPLWGLLVRQNSANPDVNGQQICSESKLVNNVDFINKPPIGSHSMSDRILKAKRSYFLSMRWKNQSRRSDSNAVTRHGCIHIDPYESS